MTRDAVLPARADRVALRRKAVTPEVEAAWPRVALGFAPQFVRLGIATVAVPFRRGLRPRIQTEHLR